MINFTQNIVDRDRKLIMELLEFHRPERIFATEIVNRQNNLVIPLKNRVNDKFDSFLETSWSKI